MGLFSKKYWNRKIIRKVKNDGGAAYMDEGSLKFGTVGCVVMDQSGNLAAATSTKGG
ncbi:MAG: isoaspartyl peptidase/L-asparaginase [Crocinitomicaceae bacterium]